MSVPSKAIFLSYASQDAEAAWRICEALRAAGLVVWFDQNELRGGDAWDASIRKKIKECALFVPVISANTESRSEGYFRLEWKLAVDRSHLMADDQAFLLPVVIDDTPDASARVPDRFRERQWSRLPAGEKAKTFAERARRLLENGEVRAANATPTARQPGSPVVAKSGTSKWLIAGLGTVVVALVAFIAFRAPVQEPPVVAATKSVAETASPPRCRNPTRTPLPCCRSPISATTSPMSTSPTA